MIDLKFLRENPDVVRASQTARGDDPGLVDAVLAADEQRRTNLLAFENLRAQQKSMGKQVAQAKGEEKQALLAQTKELAAQVKAAQAAANEAESTSEELAYQIANITLSAPPGGEEDFVVVETRGTPRDFAAEGFEPQDHVDVAQGLKAMDIERGAKVSGARFIYLTGVGAQLEIGLQNAAMDQAVRAGFIPMVTPTMVRPETMRGTGFLGAHSDEIYRLERDDLYLVGTSEVALAGYHSGEILDLGNGPLRYAGWSSCYRREAGAAGRDTRGAIRVHQFNKVEMFSYCRPEDAEDEHQRLLGWEHQMLAKIDVPYRVIDTAAGDLGTSAARKFDCEAWLPSQNRYFELTSTSNCTTFQARRLNIRERTETGATRYLATLNGTLATSRWIVAIIENHQQKDGSVVVPAGLRPYMNGVEVLEPVG
ncbi:MAG: serine--tRNA ligase [Cellulomonadaceae bacterium]|nr:serine--tRNA ligase [Cellulomonadaceae bacterium]